jgi:hypothetical protein
VFVRVSPRKLTNRFRRNTEVRANAEIQFYMNKWLRISGRISQVSESRSVITGEVSHILVSFIVNPFSSEFLHTPLVMMYFHPKWRDRLVILTRGDRLIVDGRIERVSLLNVALEDCEIVAS